MVYGALNRHHLTIVRSRGIHLNSVGESTSLVLSKWATDNSLRALSDLDNLQTLNLTFNKVTDAGLVHIQGLTNLKTLILPKQITDAGLVHLKGLTNLEQLDLVDTKVTDAGLVHLKGLTNLQELHLSDTQVTVAGLAAMQQTLPTCEIMN